MGKECSKCHDLCYIYCYNGVTGPKIRRKSSLDIQNISLGTTYFLAEQRNRRVDNKNWNTSHPISGKRKINNLPTFFRRNPGQGLQPQKVNIVND